jgi:hypothetical protein
MLSLASDNPWSSLSPVPDTGAASDLADIAVCFVCCVVVFTYASVIARQPYWFAAKTLSRPFQLGKMRKSGNVPGTGTPPDVHLPPFVH